MIKWLLILFTEILNGDRIERKRAYLDRLQHQASDASVLIAVADKLHNLTDQIENYKKLGDTMWRHFSSPPMEQVQWFRAVLDIGRARIPDCPLLDELEVKIETFRVIALGATACKDLAV